MGKIAIIADFTLEMILKPGEKQVANAHIIGYHGNNAGFALQSKKDNQYYLVYGAGGSYQCQEGITLDAAKFHYLVITKQKKMLRVYVDGVQAASMQLPTD